MTRFNLRFEKKKNNLPFFVKVNPHTRTSSNNNSFSFEHNRAPKNVSNNKNNNSNNKICMTKLIINTSNMLEILVMRTRIKRYGRFAVNEKTNS